MHTRRLEDPAAAFERLLPPMRELAAPPRSRRRAGSQRDRGPLGRHAQGPRGGDPREEQSAGGFLFAGDDLGDIEAFEAVAALREQGLPTLLVAAASDEQSALVPLADVVVPGPDGVLDLLRQLTADAVARTS